MSAASALADSIRQVSVAFADWPQVARTFERCFPNTLDTALRPLPDGGTFVVTGDIPAMWLRDAAAQVWPYLPLCAGNGELRRLIAGVIQTQARQLLLDPYANAFNLLGDAAGHAGDVPERPPGVWERKFELDSLCYPLRLAHAYWQATGDAAALGDEVRAAARQILSVMRTERRHAQASDYRFWRPGAPETDNLPNGGRGQPVAFTGMIWSAFRPSDDACELNYHIPGNMMAAVELGHLSKLARAVWQDEALAGEALDLQAGITRGIEEFGKVEHPRHGSIYAYETDGLGQHVLMDDANIPSLLSVPYLGYRPADDPTYRRTRAFVLSADNPYFAVGGAAAGVGSPHTPPRHIWPLAVAMRGLSATDAAERGAAVRTLVTTTAGTGLMHESFHADDPGVFTREWFGWANSLFAELVLTTLRA